MIATNRQEAILAAFTQLITERAYLAGTRYKWNGKAARYYDTKTGRFVSEARVYDELRRYTNDTLETRLVNLTQKMIDGNLRLPDWQTQIAQSIKDGYVVNMIAARGGKKNVTPADWGRLGGRLRFEYSKLNAFAQEIKLGMLTDRQILARIRLYARGARTAFFDGKTAAKIEAGYTMERRRTTPAEHCEDCIAYEAQGWQPIGSLPEPGVNSECLHNCKCYKEYRR